jgi:4-amino-4-deoxy-L-arabinose transferase-like glycosyltransferase
MRRPSPLAIATLAGLALRLGFLVLEPRAHLVGDEHAWTDWGAELASPAVAFSPLGSRLIFYPPVYPYFIAVGLKAFGSLGGVKAVQAVVSALLVPAVGLIGRRAFGPGSGVVAAWFTALYPDLVWYSVHFWSESVFLVLLFWAFERVMAAAAEGRPGTAAAAGLLFGLAILTRETALYFAPFVAVFLAADSRDGAMRRAGVFLAAALATVVPWTIRNQVVYQAFVPVSTASGLNLWQGNADLDRAEVYAEYAQVPGRIPKYQFARRKGIEAIVARQPWWLFDKLRSELPRFFEADSLAVAHVRRDAYGSAPDWVEDLVWAACVVPYLALLPLFVVGLWRAPLSRSAALLLAFFVVHALLHVATHGFARYRLPVMPVIFLFAAAATSVPAVPSRLRAAAAAAAALALLAAVVPSLTVKWRAAQSVETPPADETRP